VKRPVLIAGGVVLTGGLAVIVYGWLFGDYRTMKDHAPDSSAVPGSTGYKLVNALLPRLRAIAEATGIPLGLQVAWIAKESGGKLGSHTGLDERGLYQLMPAESKSLGLDHERLSTDLEYSLGAGTKLIRQYQSKVDDLGVAAAPRGSALYWLLVKLVHTVGAGQTKKWVKAAQAAGAMGSWGNFESFVLGQRWAGPQPRKWLPFLDAIYRLGRPFGFGSESAPLVSGLPVARALLGLDVLAAT
jgi:hypothetical protein